MKLEQFNFKKTKKVGFKEESQKIHSDSITFVQLRKYQNDDVEVIKRRGTVLLCKIRLKRKETLEKFLSNISKVK